MLAALLWVGGEIHRENCLHQNRAGCSVLPWESGHSKAGGWKSAAGTANPFDHLPPNPYDR